MNPNKMTARIVGVLFIVQMIAAVLSHSVILDPILYGANFLADVSANAAQVKIAMLFDLICGAALVSIAVLLFPILKKYSERIALWYIGIRVIEFTTLIFSGIFLLTIFSVSQEYVQAGMPESSYLQPLGNSMAIPVTFGHHSGSSSDTDSDDSPDTDSDSSSDTDSDSSSDTNEAIHRFLVS